MIVKILDKKQDKKNQSKIQAYRNKMDFAYEYRKKMNNLKISEVEYSEGILSIDPPLVLRPSVSENDGFFIVDDQRWGIRVIAPTQEQLIAEVKEEISFLWDTYAEEDDEVLTEHAKALKYRLLSTMKPHKKDEFDILLKSMSDIQQKLEINICDLRHEMNTIQKFLDNKNITINVSHGHENWTIDNYKALIDIAYNNCNREWLDDLEKGLKE